MKSLSAIAVLSLFAAACGDNSGTQGDAPEEVEGTEEAETTNESATPDDPDEVTVTMWFNGTPDAHGEVLEELIPEFEEQNPHITVDWELTAWDSFEQQIATAAAGGTLPDIIFAFSNRVAGFAERGMLADHSEWFDPDDFVPATVDLTTWDDTWYMLPTWFSASSLSYRTDLIEEGGNDASSPPADWDEWLAWAEGATIRDGGSLQQLGFYSSSLGINRANLFARLVEGNGGQMFSDDGTEVAFNSPQGVEAAAFLQELSECCDQPGALEADNIGLGQGRTAMVYNNHAFREWQDEFPDLVDYGHLTAVPPGPSGSGESGGVGLGANTIGITTQANHPDEAAELLRFLVLDPDNIVQLAGLGGSIPAAVATEGHEYFDSNPWVNHYYRLSLEHGRADPAHPEYAQLNDLLEIWTEELVSGAMEPEEMVNGAAEEIQAEIIDRTGVPVFTADQ